MNRLQYVAAFFLLFLTLDVFARASEEIEKLATPNAHKAALSLSKMGKEIIPELKGALQHKNLQIRQFATAILCEIDLKSCQEELRKKISSQTVEYSEKLFYASFLYSSNSEEGREFLVNAVEKDNDLQALQALVDAYDRENLDIFFSLLEKNIIKSKHEKFNELSPEQIKVVNLCIRGIKTSGNKAAVRNLYTMLEKSDYPIAH